jgi:hypothetical protein
MPSAALFGISVTFGLAVWGVVSWQYIWPALSERPNPENLKPILLLHAFRFLGLAFVVPGVVSPELPATFAQPVAYGDFMTAVLALLANQGDIKRHLVSFATARRHLFATVFETPGRGL